jgi:hypothetical protein
MKPSTRKKQAEDQDKAMSLCKINGVLHYIIINIMLGESKPEQ